MSCWLLRQRIVHESHILSIKYIFFVYTVPAKIASFSSVLMIPWHHSVTLPCKAVGNPPPQIMWKIR
jgi:hypothetical protein